MRDLQCDPLYSDDAAKCILSFTLLPILTRVKNTKPITVASLYKASAVFARSNTRIVGSNVCVRLFCLCVVLCVSNGLATD
jgi:hypothetical protein